MRVGEEEGEACDDLRGLGLREAGGGTGDGYRRGVGRGGGRCEAEARAGAPVAGCAGACGRVGGNGGGDHGYLAGVEVALGAWGCNGYGAEGVLGSQSAGVQEAVSRGGGGGKSYAGVTVTAMKLAQSEDLTDNGKPLVPVTALKQLSALQARRASVAVENAPLAMAKGRRKEKGCIAGRVNKWIRSKDLGYQRATGLEKILELIDSAHPEVRNRTLS